MRQGEYSLQCGGLRDFFAHASLSNKELKVRLVEAINYDPFLNDLIQYAHSLTEIYISALDRWVIFDPWFGVMTHNGQEPIGINELTALKDYSKLTVIPIVEKVPRVLLGKSQTYFGYFFPENLKLNQFSCGEFGCSPGYVEYFRNLYIHNNVSE